MEINIMNKNEIPKAKATMRNVLSCSAGRRLLSASCLFALSMLLPYDAQAVRAKKGEAGGEMKEEAKIDFQANDMLKKGVELLEQKQDERALKLISSVPRMFPGSKVRFQAYLVLGKYYVEKRNFDLAAKQFIPLGESDDPELQAEGLYQTGICHYFSNNYDKAFMALRKVTNDYAGSIFANEAYYYIGQCHFKQGRWAKAIEALEMVGTSVSDVAVKGPVRTEAGQRLYVKIYDLDLVVLAELQKKLEVEIVTKSGDREKVRLEPLGKSGEFYIGSIPTQGAEPKPADGILEIMGGDSATVTYNDENTESGKRNQKEVGNVEFVSTASIGFTDGAYREYTKGVFADQECFIRVKDLDKDISSQRDTLKVQIATEYKEEKTKDETKQGVELGDEKDKWLRRTTVELTLKETEPHSGIFVGSLLPSMQQTGTEKKPVAIKSPVLKEKTATTDVKAEPGKIPAAKANTVPDAKTEPGQNAAVAAEPEDRPEPGNIQVLNGDELVLTYTDEKNMLSADPSEIDYRAKLLIGQIQDVKIENRIVDSLDLKARKNLIEAKIFLKLGQIFKDVGLNKNASEKAEEGLSRIDDVLSTSMKASIDRSLVEEAFSVKWELLLVQDKLPKAIEVCQTLTRLFPDSTLVDRALLRIGQAKVEANQPDEAIGIFSSIINLPKSDLKAESQYSIGTVIEKTALARAKPGEQADLGQAMLAYKKCADTYPESPFAGESLDKIANYYITIKDYQRAVDLMEQVFQDYPDASFLDKMLFKWVIATYRMGNYPVAKQKAEQLLSEYPNSPLAEKAKQFMETIQKKM